MALGTTAYHGVTFRELPTSILSPIVAATGINVVIGASPIHLTENPELRVNRPVMCTSLADARAYVGYSDDWVAYPLCEHMDSAFRLFGIQPVVYIPVLDPATHRVAVLAVTAPLVAGALNTQNPRIIESELVVLDAPGGDEYELGVDYFLSRDALDNVIINRIVGGGIPAANSPVTYSGFAVAPALVTSTVIIGGVDAATGQNSGIEVIEDVFPVTGLIPGILYTPRFSHDPAVAAILATKAESIDGCFKARAIVDVAPTVLNPIDVLQWKTTNNIVDPRQDCCFLHLELGDDRHYHFGSQWGPLQMLTDAVRGGNKPYWSASNQALKCNASVLADGTEMRLTQAQANALNLQGVVTALNWGTYGWRAWGNWTAARPNTADYKDSVIVQKRMSDFIGNTFVLTMNAEVDRPGNRRMIDTVVQTFNRWLNSLTLEGALLGGRIEFRHEDNSYEQLLSGKFVFHTFSLAPPPASWIENLLEIDVGYLDVLFEGGEGTVAA
jgi:phage tail sheath protein FI